MGRVHNCRIGRSTPLQRGGPLPKRNHARVKRLREEQFGDDGYREHILSLRCLVTGRRPVDPAHVLGTRGAGAGPEGLAPLSREIHDAFDSSMTEKRLMEVHGFTREPIREWARAHRAEWEAGLLEEGASS